MILVGIGYPDPYRAGTLRARDIAATAVHPDYRVATRAHRSFARIDGLAVECS